ncbi:hypothetical protein MJG53_003841 [Ovis ammon polii x Ovis aries]|uniref:Uncharacterized protein n=1 Tax=Ovis ammon polii x Ovis aries TaxID=2918886 RepID=A0ACB9V7Z9_9CETA|nr:hypothetical protein MJG53_003841 [Ovis ammon polii x Ovis aries]
MEVHRAPVAVILSAPHPAPDFERGRDRFCLKEIAAQQGQAAGEKEGHVAEERALSTRDPRSPECQEQRGIAFPLLISEESGEVVERRRRRETRPVWASDKRAAAVSVSPPVGQEPGAVLLRAPSQCGFAKMPRVHMALNGTGLGRSEGSQARGLPLLAPDTSPGPCQAEPKGQRMVPASRELLRRGGLRFQIALSDELGICRQLIRVWRIGEATRVPANTAMPAPIHPARGRLVGCKCARLPARPSGALSGPRACLCPDSALVPDWQSCDQDIPAVRGLSPGHLVGDSSLSLNVWFCASEFQIPVLPPRRLFVAESSSPECVLCSRASELGLVRGTGLGLSKMRHNKTS